MTSPRLPDGWTEPEAFSDEVCVPGGLRMRRSGLSSSDATGREVTGSAASSSEDPYPRSCFELLERISILEALAEPAREWPVRASDGRAVSTAGADVLLGGVDPPGGRLARSNGVALHCDWRSACSRAYAELAERDRILRSWHGEIEPASAPIPRSLAGLHMSGSYEIRACTFAAPEGHWSADLAVAAVFGFPRHEDAPLFCGYAARPNRDDAVDAAAAEGLQVLAFLVDEPVPESPPPIEPTPLAHLDRLLWRPHHAALRRWLDHGHGQVARRRQAPDRRRPRPTVRFVDVTPPWLDGRFKVAKATCGAAEPLVFGLSPASRHLPAELRLHPIG